MAFSISRAAATALGRRAAPAGLISFRGTGTRESLRTSPLMHDRVSEQLSSFNLMEMMYARTLLDDTLTKAGYPYSKDVQFNRLEKMVNKNGERLDKQAEVLDVLKDRKGDITTVNIGKQGTLNLIGVFMVLFKIDEKWPFIEPTFEMVKRFF